MKILHVDDDAAVLAVIGLVLARRGWSVERALSGEEALLRLRKADFDWLLTDGDLKTMTGLELAERAGRLRPGLKIALLSGTAWDICGTPIRRAFLKPVDIAELRDFLAAA